MHAAQVGRLHHRREGDGRHEDVDVGQLRRARVRGDVAEGDERAEAGGEAEADAAPVGLPLHPRGAPLRAVGRDRRGEHQHRIDRRLGHAPNPTPHTPLPPTGEHQHHDHRAVRGQRGRRRRRHRRAAGERHPGGAARALRRHPADAGEEAVAALEVGQPRVPTDPRAVLGTRLGRRALHTRAAPHCSPPAPPPATAGTGSSSAAS